MELMEEDPAGANVVVEPIEGVDLKLSVTWPLELFESGEVSKAATFCMASDAASPALASTGLPPPNNLGIYLNPTDATKSVDKDSKDGSYRVRKDAQLKLLYDADGTKCQTGHSLECWVSYKNEAFKHPVVVQDLDLKQDNTPKSLAVFELKSDRRIRWTQEKDGVIVAKVDAMTYDDPLFINFRANTSEVKKGGGWDFHLRLIDRQGEVVAIGQIGIKCMKILRNQERGIKRKRHSSTNYSMPPSPSGSESSEGEDSDHLGQLTVTELINLLHVMSKKYTKITEELSRRNC